MHLDAVLEDVFSTFCVSICTFVLVKQVRYLADPADAFGFGAQGRLQVYPLVSVFALLDLLVQNDTY
jgi:hypothetical protein